MKFQNVVAVLSGIFALFSTGATLRAQSISMSYVTVGNPNNAADPATGSLYGSVSYTYDIGEYDVTDSQYCTFLNEVDPTGANTLALYSPQGDAEYGITFHSGAANGSKYSVIPGCANMPVVDVSYWDALRFVNWMNNGEGNASTETGAYTLLGGNTYLSGRPSNAVSLLANPQHNAGAMVWLPSENEWYKAAYYDPASSTYSTYATQSNTAPGNIIGSGSNEANYYTGSGLSVTQSSNSNSNQNYLTATGAFSGSASYYGTYDQSGDVFNWIDTTVDTDYPVGGTDYPVLRGGDWSHAAGTLSSVDRFYNSPELTDSITGFRVVEAIPEPNSFMLMLVGALGLALMRRKPFEL